MERKRMLMSSMPRERWIRQSSYLGQEVHFQETSMELDD